MSSGALPSSYGDHPPPWQQCHQWQAYGPPPHQYSYAHLPPHHYLPTQPLPNSYYQSQARYATPATEGQAQAPPIYDLTQDEEEHRETKRSREDSPATTTSWANLGTDWTFLRQHILDMSEVLMQTMCPVSFGPHNTGRCHVILLLRQKSPECWQAVVTCDGRMVIEAPERTCKQDAMMTLSEVIAARLGKCIIREWEPENAQTDMEEGSDGSKFAIDFKR